LNYKLPVSSMISITYQIADTCTVKLWSCDHIRVTTSWYK